MLNAIVMKFRGPRVEIYLWCRLCGRTEEYEAKYVRDFHGIHIPDPMVFCPVCKVKMTTAPTAEYRDDAMREHELSLKVRATQAKDTPARLRVEPALPDGKSEFKPTKIITTGRPTPAPGSPDKEPG